MLAGLVITRFGKAGERSNAQVLDEQVLPHATRDFVFKPVILLGKAIASLLELQLSAHARQHNGWIKWLGNVINRTEFQAVLLIFGGDHGRDEDHGDVPGLRVVAQVSKDFVPVHFGHHDIKQDQVRLRIGGGGAQGILPGIGCAHAIVRLEKLTQNGKVLWRVIDDQDRLSGRITIGCSWNNG